MKLFGHTPDPRNLLRRELTSLHQSTMKTFELRQDLLLATSPNSSDHFKTSSLERRSENALKKSCALLEHRVESFLQTYTFNSLSYPKLKGNLGEFTSLVSKYEKLKERVPNDLLLTSYKLIELARYMTTETHSSRVIDRSEGMNGESLFSLDRKRGEAIKVSVRTFIGYDSAHILEIEELSFDNPWTHEELVENLRQNNRVVVVAAFEGSAVGYALYELQRSQLNLLNIAVHPLLRRSQIGSQIIDALDEKLYLQKRDSITVEVPESHLDAQLFFRDLGFKALPVMKSGNNGNEGMYLMKYNRTPHFEHSRQNRIMKFF